MQQPAAQFLRGPIKELGLIPHDQPGGPLVANLAAFWQQISPIVPVLPTVPTHKSCAVYNLAFEAFHGMEEIIGSIPIRSTNQFNHLEAPPFRDFVEFLSKIPKAHNESALAGPAAAQNRRCRSRFRHLRQSTAIATFIPCQILFLFNCLNRIPVHVIPWHLNCTC
jgi:hypothetical protein